jgi:hypothetical protein
MDVRGHEEIRAHLTSQLEACRGNCLQVKEAGDGVTAGERAQASTAYRAALERLSLFLEEVRGSRKGPP